MESSARKSKNKVLVMDLHGTMLNSDIPMLFSISDALNSALPESEKIIDNESLLKLLGELGYSKQNVLENSKKAIFSKFIQSRGLGQDALERLVSLYEERCQVHLSEFI